jgi:hypothetical protein
MSARPRRKISKSCAELETYVFWLILLAIFLLGLLLLLSGGDGPVKYPLLRFAPLALVDRLTGHADPGGKRHRLAAVAASGGRLHVERAFHLVIRREPDDLSATGARYKCTVMI